MKIHQSQRPPAMAWSQHKDDINLKEGHALRRVALYTLPLVVTFLTIAIYLIAHL